MKLTHEQIIEAVRKSNERLSKMSKEELDKLLQSAKTRISKSKELNKSNNKK